MPCETMLSRNSLNHRTTGFRLQHEAAITVIEKWTRIRHPGLVAVREAFTTRAFGDYCRHTDTKFYSRDMLIDIFNPNSHHICI